MVLVLVDGIAQRVLGLVEVGVLLVVIVFVIKMYYSFHYNIPRIK